MELTPEGHPTPRYSSRRGMKPDKILVNRSDRCGAVVFALDAPHGVPAAAGGVVQVHWCAHAAAHGIMVPGNIGAQLLYLLHVKSPGNIVLFRADGQGAHLNANKFFSSCTAAKPSILVDYHECLFA